MRAAADRNAAPTLRLRLDYAPGTQGLPGMGMGIVPLSAHVRQPVRELFDAGVRFADLGTVLDVTDDAAAQETVAALAFVRDLTAYGLVVNWTIRLPEGVPLPLPLGHLHPPEKVLGHPYGAEIAEVWRRKFYLGKCFWRQGPGFIEVRDRRSARQVRITFDDPDCIAAIETMSHGADISAVPRKVLSAFAGAGLIHSVGDRVWWVPYRVRRWPSPPLSV